MIARTVLVGFLVIACSAAGVAQGTDTVQGAQVLRFDVASVKQNTGEAGPPLIDGRTFRRNGRATVTNMSLLAMIQVLFLNDPTMLIEGGPDWLRFDRFDIVAQGDPGTDAAIPAGQILPRMNQMLRTLLAERFNLRTHIEHRPMQVYALTPTDPKQPAAKPRPSKTTDCAAAQNDPNARCGMRRFSASGISAVAMTLDEFALMLSATGRLTGLDRPLENRTGIAGRFDIDVMEDGAGIVGGPAQGSLLITMIKDQLGLALRSVPGERDVLVIDHAERPQPD